MHHVTLYFCFEPRSAPRAAATLAALAQLSDTLEGLSYRLDLRPLPAGDGYCAWTRRALATADDGSVSRYVAGYVFQQIGNGAPDSDAEAAASLKAPALALRHDPDGPVVTRLLEKNAAAAAAHGVSTLPSVVVDGAALAPAGDPLAALAAWVAARR